MFTTLYSYDTWNRIQNLTYPDGEVVSFNYDSGGLIKTISGQKQALSYNYLTFIGYDKFEAREHVALGNGTATDYTYRPDNRRLAGLAAKTKSARTFMNMSYGYDAVGNVLSLGNSAAIPAGTALYGGTTAYTFGYDNIYELTSATGAFTKRNVPVQKFTLAMSYDGIHNITHKTQTAFNLLSNGSITPNLPLTYNNAYAYAGGRPHAASQIGDHTFQYDLDGNQAGWKATDSAQNRVIVWDEDNRMQSVTDSSAQPTTFKYDDNTNRVVKKGAGGETLYINPWYVAALGRNSKQVFAGTTRIQTKLEQFPSGEGYGTGAKNLTEVYQYFYHPDHLGSTGFATDATGEVYQHLEYFPFGETWVDEVSDDTRVPYRFTGQEFDEETKLYYYGARYYDPRTSVWENPDPALGKYLSAGKKVGGVFEPRNLSSFGYVHQNPLVLVDPDGRDPQEPERDTGYLDNGYQCVAPFATNPFALEGSVTEYRPYPQEGVNETWSPLDFVSPGMIVGGVRIAGGWAVKSVATKAIQSGARSGIFEGDASAAYDAIRASTSDVADIAKNTGLKASNIQKIKQHLFEDLHLLDRYAKQGIPGEMARFDADEAIAAAWQRLQKGAHTPEDLQLLRYETAERWYMQKHGPSYDAAHTAASKRFPAPPLE